MKWFINILDEQPLLFLIFLFHLYGSSLDLALVYWDWRHGYAIDQMKLKFRKVVRFHLAALLELIFRGLLNVSANNLIGDSSGREWVSYKAVSDK